MALALGVISVAPANAIRLDFDKNVDETIQDYQEGYIIQGDEWAEWGIEIRAEVNNNRWSPNDRLTLYNTDPNKPNHKDPDLRTGAQWGTNPDKDDPNSHHGNILIIQENETTEDGRYKNPDDDADGGKITFDFLGANLKDGYIYEDLKIGLVDIDNSERSSVTVYYLDENDQEHSQTLTLKMKSEQVDYKDFGVTEISKGITPDSNGHRNNSLWEFDFTFLNQELDSLKSISKVEVDYKASGGCCLLRLR